ncbi:unnamed protein product [Chironomus riparius]|uniref:Uncharacterized protein n=1 Tax=Chironomus riparius TaxID=315576 RepID=A0A9N9RWK8_9DIPT|nr:unnamed protein product [Chironomus riparius]
MLLGSCCGCDLSLVKAGIAVGLLDILSMVSQILLRWKHFSDDFSIIMISIGIFSIAMICAIILIHGIIQMNKSLLLYWMVVAFVRIFLMSLFCGMILYVKPNEQFFFGMEVIGCLILIYSLLLIWQLYFEMKGGDSEHTNLLKDEEASVH